ncbi:glutathione S-transferase family protein [Arsukibacterium sp.]|uniref:glutathione S-transferase family protein n=1 Tax=Arsukibacterium sp. TaxID=1977258 RepID=UPI002FD8EC1B
MKLYGSQTSPYVRRIRLLLANEAYQFVNLNIFDGPDRATLINYNPARKIPMLLDHEQVIYDSGVIFRYLADKFGFAALSWAEENQLTLINAANDSLVELLLCKRSGFNILEDKLFFSLQHERVSGALAALEQLVAAGEFSKWQYPAIALYCLLDWISFRELTSLAHYPKLQAFLQQHQSEAAVALSDPRIL